MGMVFIISATTRTKEGTRIITCTVVSITLEVRARNLSIYSFLFFVTVSLFYFISCVCHCGYTSGHVY
jgi:hypothetical protein